VELPDLGEKVGPLPLWGWLLLGTGGVVLLIVLARKPASATADPGSMGYAAPTGDQMTGNAINDLKNTIAADQEADNAADAARDEAFASALAGTQQQLLDTMSANRESLMQLIGANQDATGALISNQNAQAQAYQQQLAASNAGFYEQMLALMQSFKGNGTATVTNGTVDPLAGAPSWLVERLKSGYWQTRKYVKRDDSTLGTEYSAAVNDALRSDNATGLNSAGVSAAAQEQINRLIAQGQVALNPLYHG
jgi:hypothetical protein